MKGKFIAMYLMSDPFYPQNHVACYKIIPTTTPPPLLKVFAVWRCPLKFPSDRDLHNQGYYLKVLQPKGLITEEFERSQRPE